MHRDQVYMRQSLEAECLFYFWIKDRLSEPEILFYSASISQFLSTATSITSFK